MNPSAHDEKRLEPLAREDLNVVGFPVEPVLLEGGEACSQEVAVRRGRVGEFRAVALGPYQRFIVGYSHVTVHGFRSTFATWAEECTDYPDGVREAALAHKYKSATTAAYQRGQKLEKRRALMSDWAQFLAGSNVVSFREVG
jgi:integrase